MTHVATPPGLDTVPTLAPASPKQQLLETLRMENPTTLKVLKAFPKDKGEFRPHPRSNSARELAFTLISDHTIVSSAINGTFKLGTWPAMPEANYETLVDMFARESAALVELLERTPEARLFETTEFMTGRNTTEQIPLVRLAWMCLFDQIHHRGQLSVYVRMAGGKVPSIYGPSADEPW